MRIVRLSFNAKLYLLFGTPSLFKALLYPNLTPLPLNGLEYEHEENLHQAVGFLESFTYDAWTD